MCQACGECEVLPLGYLSTMFDVLETFGEHSVCRKAVRSGDVCESTFCMSMSVRRHGAERR